MREIKFRAWVKDYKKMYYGVSMLSHFDIDIEGFHLETKFSIAMQSTGLLDKNGKEIYEGDKFQYTEHSGYMLKSFMGRVLWLQSGWGYNIVDRTDGDLFTKYFSEHDELDTDILKYLEVIGNIYENPELLNDQS